MPNSLDLQGDGDDTALAEELESVFGIHFSDAELAGAGTVGDLHDAILRRFPARKGACLNAMAFYRLRGALAEISPGVRVRPATVLEPLAGDNARAFMAALGRTSDLRLPGHRGGAKAYAAAWIALTAFIGFIAALLANSFGGLLVALAVGVLAACLAGFDRGRLPSEASTLGDLVRKVAHLNYGRLVREGGAVRERETWAVITEVLSAETTLSPEQMGRDTLLFGAPT